MTARVIDGVKLSATIREDVAQRAAKLATSGIQPGLAVILVGSDPASQVYVRNKVAACEKAGFHSVLEQYGAELTQEALLARVRALNEDPSIHGILVQLPLPAHIDSHLVIETYCSPKRRGWVSHQQCWFTDDRQATFHPLHTLRCHENARI